MIRILLAVLFLIPAGDGFGEATAAATEVASDTISVDIQVEIPNRSSGSVVVHLIEPGEQQQTVALRDRGAGTYGATFEARKVDLVAVFESLGSVPRQSEPLRLTELGVERSVLGMEPLVGPLVDVVEGESNENSQWGWLGLAFGAAALALLAFWVLGSDGPKPPDLDVDDFGVDPDDPELAEIP